MGPISEAQAAKLDRDSRVEVFTCLMCGAYFNVRWSDGDLLDEQCVGCGVSAPAIFVRLACEPFTRSYTSRRPEDKKLDDALRTFSPPLGMDAD